ncbi:MAG: OsmC family protein [Polyangiaceae bacterium]
MSEHHAQIDWSRAGGDFSLGGFSRDHQVRFGTGQALKLSATSEYRGNDERVNPEELLLAALSSCHMMTFLALAARSGVLVDAYRDDSVGYLEKGAEGRVALARVRLRPRVTFADGATPTLEAQRALHDKAHRGCFIANSVKTAVEVELETT